MPMPADSDIETQGNPATAKELQLTAFREIGPAGADKMEAEHTNASAAQAVMTATVLRLLTLSVAQGIAEATVEARADPGERRSSALVFPDCIAGSLKSQ